MGPLGQLILLALVLLEVAVAGRGCDQQGTPCEVTAVRGSVVTIECGAAPNTNHPVTSKDLEPTTVDYQSKLKENVNILEPSFLESKRLNFTDNFYNETSFNFNHEDSDSNTTSTESALINKNISSISNKTTGIELLQPVDYDSGYIEKRLISTFLGNWLNITTVEVSLLKTCQVVDLSSFYNCTSVILKTFGNSSFKLRGIKNVSTLTCAFCDLREISFVRNFDKLEFLNLTGNNIKNFPTTELPKLISWLDLSRNNISFDTDTILPHNLQRLNLSYNSLGLSENVVITGNLRILDMRESKLNKMPILQMQKLEELYLSGNNISTLKEGVFRNLTSLTVLELGSNYLTSLDEKVFQGLNKLQWLDMSENKVKSLDPATFQYVNNLVTLSLSGNTNLGNTQDVEDASFLFGTGQRLQIIEASRTNLTKIPSTLTRSVKKLLLADNAIEVIQCGELDSFPLLQTMDLSSNSVFDIEEDAFGRLEFLSELFLSDNKLESIPKSLPNQLQIFDLRCNLIKSLAEYDLLGLQKLRVLLLSRNKISAIKDGAFGQLSSLEVLDLSHNPIKSLSRTSFIGPRMLKEMYLISLTDLIPLTEPLSFPAPESSHLEVLNIESSPVLATQLMDDVAALTMFHELFDLNLSHCRLSTIRSDLPKYLPRLHTLQLKGNVLNCTNIIWLVKWLQALNISMQDTRRLRREIYNSRDICCERDERGQDYDGGDVICSSPAYLSGKEIISLKEEDFPDLKLTSSSLPPLRQVFTTEHYLPPTLADSASDKSKTVSGLIDPAAQASLSTQSSSTQLPSEATTDEYESQGVIPPLLKDKTIIHQSTLNISESKTSKVQITKKYINRNVKKWKYLKSETKYKLSPHELDIIFLNGTEKSIDNHLNGSISSDAFISHDQTPASHPGMVIFLLIVSTILVAAAVMVYSQCSRSRRGAEYHQQQDIEVTDLW